MAFRTNAAPYQRAKRSTLQIMLELTIALAIVWIAAVVFTFIEAPKYGVKSILMMLVALVTTAACDVLNTVIRHKKDSKTSLKDEILYDLVHNYSYVTAIIFTLTLPVWASYYVVIIGSVFATVVVKHLFGGFGKNIFNPAIMARIFVGLCFLTNLDVANSGLVHDSISGATVTTQFNGATSWLSDMPLDNVSIADLFLGNYFGALGETFTILILVLGVVLSIRNVINWRTPVFYIGTVVLTSLVIGLVCGFENPLTYVGYHVALGGLAFGAVFMLTDPVTGPTSSFGKSLMAVLAGLLTVLIRVKGGYPEGVMYSIAVCNLLSPAVDYLTVGKTNAKLPVKYGVVFGLVAVSIALCTGLAWNVNGGKEVYSINGIAFDEYATVTETYGLTLKDGHDLYASEGSETYVIKDANGNVVSKVYSVTLSEPTMVEIEGGSYTVQFTMNVYVAIATADSTVYDIAIVTGGTAENYSGFANAWAEENVIGNDSTTISGLEIKFDESIGASYSAKSLQEAIAKAYELYAAAQ